LKNKKVIVTGGMGFIGSHLTERLLEDNEVTVIDNESKGDQIENAGNRRLRIHRQQFHPLYAGKISKLSNCKP